MAMQRIRALGGRALMYMAIVGLVVGIVCSISACAKKAPEEGSGVTGKRPDAEIEGFKSEMKSKMMEKMGGAPEGKMGGAPQGKMGGAPEGKMGGASEGKMGGALEGKMGGAPEGKTGGAPEGKAGGAPEGKTGGTAAGE
jgi:hypothetical protein